ncbi:GNAT family N-acetyltransferase [Acidipila sp. EB88]|uniref:GNAT family N-acetyltransferase n=1 Tax=Acidipila sp. EB88 TaxID=2305226 RepID=UPI001F398F9E|nr:GNAT family N-acetyltransferase [Acidipila sp. EB88]
MPGLDTQLLRDRTYFVAEWVGQIVSSGGWNSRGTLCGADAALDRQDAVLDLRRRAAKIRAIFVDPDWAGQWPGSRMLRHCELAAAAEGFAWVEMGSTLTGVPLYARRSYQEQHRFSIALGNGESLPVVFMTRPLPVERGAASPDASAWPRP